jgi:hypothetical protein
VNRRRGGWKKRCGSWFLTNIEEKCENYVRTLDTCINTHRKLKDTINRVFFDEGNSKNPHGKTVPLSQTAGQF